MGTIPRACKAGKEDTGICTGIAALGIVTGTWAGTGGVCVVVGIGNVEKVPIG
jgi:hypothetical protein